MTVDSPEPPPRRVYFGLSGTIGRLPFFLLALTAAGLKFLIDSVLVAQNQQTLHFWDYWVSPSEWIDQVTFSWDNNTSVSLALLAVATVFVWFGIPLIIRRLRAIGWPLYLSLIFFIPAVNLLFFAVLCLVPSRVPGVPQASSDHGSTGPTVSRDDRSWFLELEFWSATMAGGAVGVAAGALCFFALAPLALGLFLGIPFLIGLTAAWVYSRSRPRSLLACVGVACAGVLVASGAVLLFAFEGVLCLLMAAPFGLGLAALGGAVGHHLGRSQKTPGLATLCVLTVLTPTLLAVESRSTHEPPLHSVRTSVIIDARPEVVWQNVVAFPPIPEPLEWYFRLGIAYPLRAEIKGHGADAIRTCVFSTGAFVEPIEVWDEPRLLRFSVTENPAPLRELSLFPNLAPPHLDGFLESEQGQFELVERPGGRTELVGTTWYRHKIYPAFYWRFWSDAIIHRIHLRVLRHIQAQSEYSSESRRS